MNFKEAKRLLMSIGWTLDRVKGSHYIFRLNDDDKNEFILSQHRGDMKHYVIRKLKEMKKEYDAQPKNIVDDISNTSIISEHW